MKKLLIIASLIILGSTQMNAQDCKQIVLPHFNYNTALLDVCPDVKIEQMCQFSRNAFYWADSVPEGAMVFELGQLTFKRDGSHLSNNEVIDLNTLSYYAYDFEVFQAKDERHTIYFATPGSKGRYLAVRSHYETHLRTEFPERFENK